MSDGREERQEQEARRRWREREDGDDAVDRGYERDSERERKDS
jgi:hypothetical protein